MYGQLEKEGMLGREKIREGRSERGKGEWIGREVRNLFLRWSGNFSN